jgi:hypothetical protein
MARRGNAPVRIRLAPEADAIQRSAFRHAIRLGHPYLGSEHTLLALAGAHHPAGAAMREHGVTPDRVEEQITRLSGGGLFGDLDRDALASLGIDVEAVSDRVAQSLGPEALHRASQAAFREHRVRWWDPRRVRVAGSRREGVFLPIPPGTGFVQCMKHARIEGEARHDSQIGVQYLALGLLSVTNGLAPAVLAALDVSVPDLRAAIADRA